MKRFFKNYQLLKDYCAKFKIYIFATVVFLLAGFLFFYCVKSAFSENEDLNEDEISLSTQKLVKSEQEESETFPFPLASASISMQTTVETKINFPIYIDGSVKNPGVYYMENGAILLDAVDKAGGITEEAELSGINLAEVLQPNAKYHFPKIGEVIPEKESQVNSDNLSSSNKDGNLKLKININTASIEDLITLPGIGRSGAKKILAYRNKYGKFTKIEDIMNVPGIKKNKFKKLKDYLMT